MSTASTADPVEQGRHGHRRLPKAVCALYYPDRNAAGASNAQGRKTARDLRFTQDRVMTQRQTLKIPCRPPTGQPPSATRAQSTQPHLVHNGRLARKQVTAGAP